VEVASLRLAPGAHTGTELVRHEGQEIVVLKTGRLTVQIGGSRTDLYAGDSLRLDAACPHRFANEADEIAEALLVVRMSTPSTYGH
jgi:mannose-6-phosphate isomerase-like protein (cupin superfamily)